MAKLTLTQLKKDITAGTTAPVYYFTGDDVYRKLETAKKIQEVLSPDDFNFVKEDASACNMGELISLANTAPVFCDRRMIVLNNADKLKKNAAEALLNYVSSPLESTCFVIMHNDAKKAKKDKGFESALRDDCVSVSFEELKSAQLAAWVQEKFEEHGLKIEQDGLIMLEDIIGADLVALNSEIEKLSLYLQNSKSKTVTQEDILASIGFSKEENPFALSNAVMDCDKALSLKLTDTMLAAGEEPVGVLSKISSCAVKMLRIKRLTGAGLSSGEVLNSAGLMPWESRLISRASYMPSVNTLVKTIDKIIETDMAFKSSSVSEPGIMIKGILLTLFSR